MEEPMLTQSFIGDKQVDQDKITAFLNKVCNIEDEEESDYEEAQTTNQLRREGKLSRGRRPFLPPTTAAPLSNQSNNQNNNTINNNNINKPKQLHTITIDSESKE